MRIRLSVKLSVPSSILKLGNSAEKQFSCKTYNGSIRAWPVVGPGYHKLQYLNC